MQSRSDPSNGGKAIWYVVAGSLVLVAAYYLGAGSTHDLSQAPVAEKTYPRLPSDALPKAVISGPPEPIASGWTELLPAEAVEMAARRVLQENEERQQREMMEREPVAGEGAPAAMMMQAPKD